MFKKILISLSILILTLAPVFAEVQDCKDAAGGWHADGASIDCVKAVKNYSAGKNAICVIDEGWDLSDCKIRPPSLIGGDLLPGTGNPAEALRNDSSGWLQNIFLNKVINILIGLTAALAVVFIILGGYQYLTSVGNEEQIKTAHKTIIWGLVGVLVAMLAFAIVQILINIDFDSNQVKSALLSTSDQGSVDQILPFIDSGWNSDEAVKNLPKAEFKEEFLPVVARFLIYGMAFVSSLVFFAAGVWLVVGWGEEESAKKAKGAITWAITGLAFAAASYALIKGLLGSNLG
jgi:hypothetical protein